MGTNSNQTRGTGRQNQGQNPNSSGRKMSAKQRKARKQRRIIIFSVEIILLLAMVGVLYLVYAKGSQGPGRVDFKEEDLGVNDIAKDTPTSKGYWNVALFGVDAENMNQIQKGSHSDSIMVASINMDNGEIKLVSVYRDTYLNIGNDKYYKCNQAYFAGGAEQAIKMLNTNLGLDIKDFVTVGYKGLSEVIDGIGGVYVDVDSEELKHINNYQIGISEVLKCDYTPVKESGLQLLNGLQATAYCRIRYTAGNDFKRAARQREVIMAIEEQAKKTSLTTLVSVFNDAVGDIYTSLSPEDIIALLGKVADYKIVDESGFPEETMRSTGNIGSKGSVVIPVNLESNVIWLHEFLFGNTDYTVTDKIKEFSKSIDKETSPYINK